jgi:site-specific DNA recombinase
MVHNFTGREGKRYRYYTCTNAIKSGRAACPSPNLPAAEVEKLVVDRIRCIARDRKLRVEVLRQAQTLAAAERENLETESAGLQRDLARYHAELQKLTADGPVRGAKANRMADLQCLIARAETRLAEVRVHLQKQEGDQVEEHDVLAAFADFDGMWSTLSPREQAQVLTLLVERIEFDVATSEIVVTFHPTAIKTLAQEQRGEAV